MHYPQNVKLFEKIDQIFAMHASIVYFVTYLLSVVADAARGKPLGENEVYLNILENME